MINVVYDATVLLKIANKDAARSGVFFCVKNVYDELKKNTEVSLSLYFAPAQILLAMEFMETYEKDVPCVNIFPKHSLLLFVNKFFRNVHKKIYSHNYLRLPFSLGMLLSQKTIQFFYGNKFHRDLIQNSQIFFSPANEISKSIRKFPNLKFFTILYDAIPLLSSYMGRSERKNYNSLVRSFGPKDNFFSISKQTERDFEKFSNFITSRTSSVIPLAAAPDFLQVKDENRILNAKKKYGIPCEKKYVFSLCTLEPRKNLFRAVNAFGEFVKKNGISDLVWVLGGGHWEVFFKEMRKKKIHWDADMVIRTGYIDDEDRAALYSGAEWFVYTSQYEGFGLPPLEAMQCGCPVITSNNSSLPEVVGDAGIMIDWDSDEQHVEAYEKYYFNEELRKENSQKGLERAKMFSWKKTVDEMIRKMKGEN